MATPNPLRDGSPLNDGMSVGASAAAREVNDRIVRFSKGLETILLTGPSGSGKERVALALHKLGRPRGSPFFDLNSASMNSALAESELFGHARGAFTGAVESRVGAFLSAGEGTLFLDEIGDMPLEQQAKLLRVLETRRLRQVGAGAREHEVRARVVAATNIDLRRRVLEGRFREDLLHRLDALRIVLPPLAQRREDIPLLARELTPPDIDLTSDAVLWLTQREWPGNVRELKNVLARAVHYAVSAQISAETLERSEDPTASVGNTSGVRTLTPDLRAHLADEERRVLEEAFARCEGNVSRIARELRVPRKTLERRLRRFGLVRSR